MERTQQCIRNTMRYMLFYTDHPPPEQRRLAAQAAENPRDIIARCPKPVVDAMTEYGDGDDYKMALFVLIYECMAAQLDDLDLMDAEEKELRDQATHQSIVAAVIRFLDDDDMLDELAKEPPMGDWFREVLWAS